MEHRAEDLVILEDQERLVIHIDGYAVRRAKLQVPLSGLAVAGDERAVRPELRQP